MNLLCTFTVSFFTHFHHTDPTGCNRRSWSASCKTWSSVKSAWPINSCKQMTVSVLLVRKQADWCTLWWKTILVWIKWDWCNSIGQFKTFLTILFRIQERHQKSSQTHVHMNRNVFLFANGTYLINRINVAIRVVGVWSVYANRVRIDFFLHLLDIHFVIFVVSNDSGLDSKVFASFKCSNMASLAYNQVRVFHSFMLQLVFSVGENAKHDWFCSSTVEWSNWETFLICEVKHFRTHVNDFNLHLLHISKNVNVKWVGESKFACKAHDKIGMMFWWVSRSRKVSFQRFFIWFVTDYDVRNFVRNFFDQSFTLFGKPWYNLDLHIFEIFFDFGLNERKLEKEFWTWFLDFLDWKCFPKLSNKEQDQ